MAPARHGREAGLEALLDLVGFDNAHPADGRKRGEPLVHRHRHQVVQPYEYRDAVTLLSDFWALVDEVLRERGQEIMAVLKVGIASYDEMKARTMRIVRGEEPMTDDQPKVWFTSTESFAKILSAGNRELLRVIADQAPDSLEELAKITGRATSNLSRTLKTMAGFGLVRMERHGRKVAPKVLHDRVVLELRLR